MEVCQSSKFKKKKKVILTTSTSLVNVYHKFTKIKIPSWVYAVFGNKKSIECLQLLEHYGTLRINKTLWGGKIMK